MADSRDWKNDPPKTLEEGFQFAEWFAEKAFDGCEAQTGQRPHTVRTDHSVLIVWPDGEVTNEIEIEYVH